MDGDDYYIDLLFYHVQLRCYVVIDLKVTDFRPEYFGKMNFYVSAVDDMLHMPMIILLSVLFSVVLTKRLLLSMLYEMLALPLLFHLINGQSSCKVACRLQNN